MAAAAVVSYTEEMNAQRSGRQTAPKNERQSRSELCQKKKFCMFHLQGVCKYTGDKCSFAHSFDEMHEARRERPGPATRKKDDSESGSSQDGTGPNSSGTSSDPSAVAHGSPQVAPVASPVMRCKGPGSSGGSSGRGSNAGSAAEARPNRKQDQPRRSQDQNRHDMPDQVGRLEAAVLRELQERNQEAVRRARGSPTSQETSSSHEESTQPHEQALFESTSTDMERQYSDDSTPCRSCSSFDSIQSGCYRSQSSRGSTEATSGGSLQKTALEKKVRGLEAAVKELQDARNMPAYVPVPSIRPPPGLMLDSDEYASS
eukprot:gnl/TRDRNA2_/TRDRNA2_174898_c0_seq6.p1 gnl/TRDRNA2_/TRDRNA2_174898_c0~~gnl/TRDRNA2_/TRDRNA2_174898_c0_seq6.p1  ORF type:complete len:316 (+),score=42.06 gnl/TRDRNA2_/TRDRNA2_174898_c0_seq6:134-1081(+)